MCVSVMLASSRNHLSVVVTNTPKTHVSIVLSHPYKRISCSHPAFTPTYMPIAHADPNRCLTLTTRNSRKKIKYNLFSQILLVLPETTKKNNLNVFKTARETRTITKVNTPTTQFFLAATIVWQTLCVCK